MPYRAVQHRIFGRMIESYIRRLEANPNARLHVARSSRDSTHEPDLSETSSGAFRCMQNIRLRRIVKHAAQNSAHYREMFASAGLNPNEIRDIEDLGRLPFTASDDLHDSARFLAVPSSQIAHVFTSSGTTKRPKKIWLTKADFDRCCNLVAAINRDQWEDERPVCMIFNVQGLYGGARYVEGVVSRLGGLSLPVGVPPLAEALELIEQFRPNLLATNPSYMAALTRHAKSVRFGHKVKAISLGGELVTSAQSALFREYWGADVSNGYGLLEIGGVGSGGNDCDSLHFNLVHNVPEIIDPETGTPSIEGELVVTTLVNEAMPLIRYRTRDRCRRVSCRCGWDAPAFQVVSRMNDSIVVCANKLYGPAIGAGLKDVEPRVTRLEIVVEHADGIDRMALCVGVPPGSSLRAEDVWKVLLRIYPALGEDHRAGAFALGIDIEQSHTLPGKFLQVRDLRVVKDNRAASGSVVQTTA